MIVIVHSSGADHMNADLADVRARLARLERQNRWLKLGLFAVLLAAGVGALVAADKTPADKPATPTLVDEKGNKRATLEMTKSGPALLFFSATGQEAGRIELTDDGFTHRYQNEKGGLITGLSLQKRGVALVAMPPGDRPQIGQDAIQQTAGTAFANDVKPKP